MFTLAISIAAIALVAILAGISLFYGGSVWSSQTTSGSALTLVNQASQLRAAVLLYIGDHGGSLPGSLAALQPDYLKTLPIPPSIAATAGETLGEWDFRLTPGVAVWLSPVQLEVCDAVNVKAENGWPGIPKFVDARRTVQCFQAPYAGDGQFTVLSITDVTTGSVCSAFRNAGVLVPCTETGIPPSSAGDPAYVPVPSRVGDLSGTALTYRIQASETTLDFFEVPVAGVSSDQVFYFHNTGTGTVVMGAVTTDRGAYDDLDPMSAGPFDVWSACEGASLAPGESCPVQVMYFAPAAPAANDADVLRVTWASSPAGSSGNAAVNLVADATATGSGIGVAGDAVLSGPDYVVTFTAGATRTVQLFRTSGSPRLYSADPGSPFELIGDTCSYSESGYEFTPSTYCVLTLRLPSDATPANYDRTLALSSNATIANVRMVASIADGSGVLQVTAADPFDTVASGGPAPQQTVSVKNIGGGVLTLTSVTVSAPYSVTANTCSPSVAAGATCTLTVELATGAAGAYYNYPLAIVSDGGSDTVLLDGLVTP